MRKFVSSHEIARLWAHQSQPEARCPSAMSFRGKDFYSYATIIASIATNPKGEKAFLLNDWKYSITTTRHQSDVRRAIPHGATVFLIPGPPFRNPSQSVPAWHVRLEVKLETALKSRQPKKSRLLGEVEADLSELRKYGEFFEIADPNINSLIVRVFAAGELVK